MSEKSEKSEKPSVIPTAAGPRGRVFTHMRKLLQASAFGGAAALGLGACPPMVCDPLPPPLNCDLPDAGSVAPHLGITARWAQGDAGTQYGVVDVDIDDWRIQLSAPQLTGATLVSSEPTSSHLRFTFAPDAGATTVVATFPASCDGGAQSVVLHLDVSGTHTVGNPIPFTLSGT